MPNTTTRTQLTPAGKPLAKARYAELLRDVQQLVHAADSAVDQHKVTANWKLGRRIRRERVAEGSGYHNAVLRDLATDTHIAVRTLQYAVRFHSTYAKCPSRGLTWAHYRVLLDRPTKAARDHYEQLAIDTPLAARALARLIKYERQGQSSDGSLIARPTTPSYLYRATVEQVIDGDTLDLRIDLGFHTDRRSRFRLAGIDCPELPSPKARAARDFVFTQLLSAKTIVVKTQRTDIYGRYVAHLFYSPTDIPIDDCFTDGTHLNNQLLKEAHAEAVPE